MLGKGLESLIPPNRQRKADGSAPDPGSVSNPQSQNQNPKPEPQRIEYLPTEEETKKEFSKSPMAPVPLHAIPSIAPISSFAPLASVPSEEDKEPEKPKEEVVFRSVEKSKPESAREPEIKKPEPKKEIVRPARQIEDDKKSPKVAESVYYIEVAKIHPNPDQPRKTFDETALKELASSIREFGVLQPIVVSKIEKETENGTEVEYELIAGERRLKASKMLGLDTIPAIVRNMRLERERLELAIIENLQRENLNPVEMARAYSRLQDEFRLTQREVASRLGKSRETVANTMRLLDLPTPIQEAIEKGQLTESHGRLLLTIDDQALQEKLFRDLLSNRLTTRELKEQASAFSHQKEEAKLAKDLPPEIKMAEDKLRSDLGAPVEIKDRGGAGKITISFYSKEELIEILKRLGAGEGDNLSL